MKKLPNLPRAYLAGPDVFFAEPLRHAEQKKQLCLKYGIIGITPFDAQDGQDAAANGFQSIFEKNLSIMESCDIIIANITPFRGVSADSGTLMELGWFWGRKKPAFAYSNAATPFYDRCLNYLKNFQAPDESAALAIENFNLPENLMVIGGIQICGGFVATAQKELSHNDLSVFEAVLHLIYKHHK